MQDGTMFGARSVRDEFELLVRLKRALRLEYWE
jgi:hypothetical protein